MASLAAGLSDGEDGPRLLTRGLPMNAKPKILLQGWLEKKGRQRRDWKRRWFVLTQLTEYGGAHVSPTCAAFLSLLPVFSRHRSRSFL